MVYFRFLASGESYSDLSYHFRLGTSTISVAVRDVCSAIWHRMQPLFMPQLSTADWRKKAEEFKERLHFPNCVSAVDGKHITARKPLRSGSDYFNYKQTHSIILMAGVDADYKFTFVDVGAKGRFSDSHVFKRSNLGKCLIAGTLGLPQPIPIEEGGPLMPFVFVGDEAFPLMEHLMRPYPGIRVKDNIPNRIFNYRLSRARQQVECAFGILAARFRVFRRPFEQPPAAVQLITQCTTVLHNYLRDRTRYEDEVRYLPGTDFTEAHDQFLDVNPTRNRAKRTAIDIREDFNKYFNSTGSVPWQLNAIERGRY